MTGSYAGDAWRRNPGDVLAWAAGAVAVALIVFMAADAASGYVSRRVVRVVSHRHVAAWVEVSTSTGANGQIETSYVQHPEQWELTTYSSIGEVRVDVGEARFNALRDGDEAVLVYRTGRWTGLHSGLYVEMTEGKKRE